MIQLILLVADTVAIFVLIHVISGVWDTLLECEDKQFKQSWRIQNLENDKHKLKGRINRLEWEVRGKNADNDNACD